MKKFAIFTLSLCLFLSVFTFVNEVYSLRLILKRVVFEEGKRAEVLTLINSTEEAQVFRLEWTHLQMPEEGGLKKVDEENLPPEIKPSKDFIRYSPRRVTLEPRSSQQVRMMLRMPANVEDGEYRSHLWIRREESVNKLSAETPKPGKAREEGKMNIGVKLLPGITIPVIVRKGNLSASAQISNASARSQGGSVLIDFDILREGDKSLYGDIDIFCNPGSGGYSLRSARGVAVYTEINRKAFSYKIPVPKDQSSCRDVLLRYTETDGYDGDPVQILTETTIPVQ